MYKNIEHKNNLFHCPHGDMTSNKEYLVKNHIFIHRPTNDSWRSYTCTFRECNQDFLRKDEIIAHLKRHQNNPGEKVTPYARQKLKRFFTLDKSLPKLTKDQEKILNEALKEINPDSPMLQLTEDEVSTVLRNLKKNPY